MSGTPEPEPPRTFVDPPRWMDGMASLFSSGLFALAGVMTGISALILCVLLAVGIVPASAAIPWILVLGLLAPLLLFLHGRADRYAGIPGGASSAAILAVTPDRRRSLLVVFLGGEEIGILSKEGDGLLLRTSRHRVWPIVALNIVGQLAHSHPWPAAVLYAGLLTDMFHLQRLRSDEPLPKGRIASAILCGDFLVLLLAGSPEQEPLVLGVPHFHRNRAAALLSHIAPFEELPAPRPPRVPRTPNAPRAPRPAPAPSTAIDAAKEKELDRALDGLKRSAP